MGRGRDVGKERFWRDLFQRWQRSKQSVRAFCVEQGLPESSFRVWRRTIAQRDQQAAGMPPTKCGGGGRDLPAFVPVRVAPEPTTATPSALEVVVGPGRVIRVPSGFDAAALRRLLAVLEEAPSC